MRLYTRATIALVAVGVLGVGLAAPATAMTPYEPGLSRTIAVETAKAVEKAKVAKAAKAKVAAQRQAAARASRAADRTTSLRSDAVRIGKAKAGRASYVAGAAGPNAFDCSGFTAWVWGQAGRSLPHSSYAQYDSLPSVTRSQLRPGDLVFYFGSGAHHVGLYIGDGLMVHAANPRRDVLVSAIDGDWYGERLSDFRRVV